MTFDNCVLFKDLYRCFKVPTYIQFCICYNLNLFACLLDYLPISLVLEIKTIISKLDP